MSTSNLLLCLSVLIISAIAIFIVNETQEDISIGEMASLNYEEGLD
jgi:hypothetical protein